MSERDPVIARLVELRDLDDRAAAARLAVAHHRRRDLLALLASPSLRADARLGDRDAQELLERAAEELDELRPEIEALELRLLTLAEGRPQ